MNIVMILAGGSGKRMGADIPKQFLKVLGKPVIVYTLEVFEKHPEVDIIEVVAIRDWIEEVWSYRERYSISKLKYVVEGGSTCQESIHNGIIGLRGKVNDDDIVMIAMSVSPLITGDIISDSFRVCKKYGNAIAGDYSIYNLSTIKDGYWSDNYILKQDHVTLNMPWTFPFGKLLYAYNRAYSERIGIDEKSYTTTLMVDLGEKLFFSKDSQANKLKLTTFDDVDMLEGYLLLQEIRKGNLESCKLIRKNKDSKD